MGITKEELNKKKIRRNNYIKYVKNNPYQLEKKNKRKMEWDKTEKGRKYYSERMKKFRKDNQQYQIRFRIYNQFRKAYKKYNDNKLISSRGLINFKEILNKLGKCPGKRKDWHIDHIIPLSFFDLTEEEDIKKAWNKDNLQWLPALENLKKSNKLIFNNNERR